MAALKGDGCTKVSCVGANSQLNYNANNATSFTCFNCEPIDFPSTFEKQWQANGRPTNGKCRRNQNLFD